MILQSIAFWIVAFLVFGVPVALLRLRSTSRARTRDRAPDQPVDASPSHDHRDSPASPPTKRTPYAGVAESILAKLIVDDADPKADAYRATIHRLFVVATVVLAVGFLGIVTAMIVALATN